MDRVRKMIDSTGRAATSAREGAGQLAKSTRRRAGQVAETTRRGAGQLAESARQGAGQIAESTRRGAGQVAETTRRGAESAREGAGQLAESTRRGAGQLAESTRRDAGQIAESARHGANVVAASTVQLTESVRERLADLATLSVAGLTTAISAELNSALASLAEGPATIYDKAMDAEYLATHIGGANHRLFDGGHTLSGAFGAVRDASTEDTIIEEGVGYMQGLFKDVTTPQGLPLANWDKGTYNEVSGFLDSQFGIPKGWFYDLNSFDAAEVLGASVGALALVLCWSRADAEQFGKLVGGLGLTAAIGANPLLLIVVLAALAKAFTKARAEGRLGDAVDGLARGAVTSAAVLGSAAVVSIGGGAGGLALLVGLLVGLTVTCLMSNVSVTDVAQVLASQLQTQIQAVIAGAKSRTIPAMADGVNA